MATSTYDKNKEKLAKDYQNLLKDAEALISSLPGEVDEKTKEARARLQTTLNGVKDRYDTVEDKVQEQMQKTDQLIRDYPYQSAGISLGIGFLVGLLLRRGN